MNDSNKTLGCVWACRFELVGLLLLVIATLLTIATANSLGIAAMFIVGMLLFGHKCLSRKVCRVCHPEEDETAPWDNEKPSGKKTSGKKEAASKK